MKYLQGLVFLIATSVGVSNADTIYDESRDRNIPIEITYPQENEGCRKKSKCPVALLSAGYGVSHLKYTFLANQLNNLGYLVIAIGHELPNDPPLSTIGNLFETRSENWRRGAKTLHFVKSNLSERLENYDFDNLLLVGHSNGGDISSWLGNESKPYVKSLITLDHRRVPLPRDTNIKALSIRASDFPADKGVLPSASEQNNSCVVKIPESRHNDMSDFGPKWLKDKINLLVRDYLQGRSCSAIKKA
ncbi:alpha/beta hydrolase [Alteromonas sp. ASW11-130]|uniref:alpha/beta hydrolase n=1 Tax=Alteromonas sp. ASW11-130 TaxID=3015775 RepID=UPI0022418975|nr:alpha/beta hydrolase [Alteromonas sp. ASW11-130]MCW8090492.1 alpha/beta hydrolase [Alteromonas sp. ASW11-130]